MRHSFWSLHCHFKHLAFFLPLMVLSTLILAACGTNDDNGGSSDKVYDLGVFIDTSSSNDSARLAGFKEGLKTLGYLEDKTIRYHAVDIAKMTTEQRQTAAADLATKNYAAYWTSTSTKTRLLKNSPNFNRPIITVGLVDAVSQGLAQTVDKPGGNVTGVDSFSTELTVKRLDWLVRLDPPIRQVYLVYDPLNGPQSVHLAEIRTEANRVGVKLVEKPISKTADSRKVVSQFKASEAQAILTVGVLPFSISGEDFKAIVEQEKLVLIGAERADLDFGSLLTYGSSDNGIGRQSAAYVDRVLHGADPGSLPILSPTKIELVLNQKLADQLNYHFSQILLSSADEIVK